MSIALGHVALTPKLLCCQGEGRIVLWVVPRVAGYASAPTRMAWCSRWHRGCTTQSWALPFGLDRLSAGYQASRYSRAIRAHSPDQQHVSRPETARVRRVRAEPGRGAEAPGPRRGRGRIARQPVGSAAHAPEVPEPADRRQHRRPQRAPGRDLRPLSGADRGNRTAGVPPVRRPLRNNGTRPGCGQRPPKPADVCGDAMPAMCSAKRESKHRVRSASESVTYASSPSAGSDHYMSGCPLGV